MADDQQTGTDLLLGGQYDSSTLADLDQTGCLGLTAEQLTAAVVPTSTWLWNGSWRLACGAGPGERAGEAMAYDPALKEVVLFGGSSSATCCSSLLSDTWAWNGAAWVRATVTQSPPPLYGASMAYDPVGQRLLLFGGMGVCVSTLLGACLLRPTYDSAATWAYSAAGWTELSASGGPPARHFAAMAGDAASCTIALFGGETVRASIRSTGSVLDDSWVWNGAWQQVTSGGLPSGRTQSGFAFDAEASDDVLYGGAAAPGSPTGNALGDTWTFSTPSICPAPTPSEAPTLHVYPDVTTDGFTVVAVGSGWVANKPEKVNLQWTEEGGSPLSPGRPVAAVTAGPGGTFSATILILPHEEVGPRILSATDGIATVSAPLLVAPAPAEPPGFSYRR